MTDNVLNRLAGEYAAIHGLEIEATIANGAYARAFTIKDHPGYVIKVGTDETEHAAIRAVMRAQKVGKAEAIVKIYDARNMGFHPASVYSADTGDYNSPVMATLVERLQMPTGPLADTWRKMYPGRLVDIAKMQISKTTSWRWDDWDNPFTALGLASLNLEKMHQSCVEAGIISLTDLKLSNVLERPGYGLVLSDLGVSKIDPSVSEKLAA